MKLSRNSPTKGGEIPNLEYSNQANVNPKPKEPPKSSYCLESADLDPDADWTPSDSSFLCQLATSHWVVNPYSSEPGVYLLQRKDDPSCVLLLQDVCYVFMIGRTALHSPRTGIWFAQDLPPDEDESTGQDQAGKSGTSGTKASKKSKKRSVFTRDLSKINLSKDVCTLYSTYGTDSSTVDRLASDDKDLTQLGARAHRTFGKFVGRSQLAQYIEGSTEQGQQTYFEGDPVQPVRSALVPRQDSRDGHFGEALMGLAEVVQHLGEDGGKVGENRGEEEEKGGETQLFFPSDGQVESSWTRQVAGLLLGGEGVLSGREEGRPQCFRNIGFVLNARWRNETRDTVRVRSYRAVASLEEEIAARQKRARGKSGGNEGHNWGESGEKVGELVLPKLDLRQSEEASQGDEEFLWAVGGGKRGENRGKKGWKRGKKRGREGGVQITVVDEPLKLGNLREVVKLVERVFYGVPVKVLRLNSLSLPELIKIMKVHFSTPNPPSTSRVQGQYIRGF